ncbi:MULTISPECIES: polyamine ABC transporter substrate-binding protein [Aminobacter]|jgi:spermidine/putrescine transport system substrate-binding protein|uniref:Spermidine/putrescine transport system substrate-binding protein n=1 Tax=Aminobacter ciceronei TaxID=150723 RepID=A0ABR6CIG6_9HYPH|nr:MULTISPECIES: spermidine/putrescine ABC transporter substrate-binding protein [Aminobacter]MBA8910924.1 spermidine/putrescine transport system substrate-binding protein [Aminobacter ciceronei]MBA9024701.1 spermidine/putrescine transport system substrate-binding protein [Aminobacter ciceronei]MRX37242.1 extracellular solute-binding protein [Aminobacter sp. MDW-2]QNH35540.1 spermidine/putrescine ABC transporter substrate-binding protein [Aminobacter sp. MDW-2]
MNVHKGLQKGHNRRDILKGASVLGGGVLAMPFLNRLAFAQPVELNILAWSGHAEPDVVAEFEAENNVKFKPKYYTGGDNMLGLISQSPPGTFDVILSDAEYVQQLNAAGYIEKLDPVDYPFDDFFPEFQHFPGHWQGNDLYSVITRFGFLGVAYNTDAITEKEASTYNVYWAEKLKGKVGHFDWHHPNLGQISLLNGNAAPYDIDEAAWGKLQEKMKTLRPQIGGFFDFGGTFSSLQNGQVLAMAGIGDWITGVLAKNGAKVRTVIPEEGGLQWTESFCIGKGSTKADLAKKWIQYITSAKGQVKSVNMAAYPAMVPNKKGWELLAEDFPAEAKRQGMLLNESNIMDLIRNGRIKFRQLPVQQSLEDWNDFWSEYKGS